MSTVAFVEYPDIIWSALALDGERPSGSPGIPCLFKTDISKLPEPVEPWLSSTDLDQAQGDLPHQPDERPYDGIRPPEQRSRRFSESVA